MNYPNLDKVEEIKDLEKVNELLKLGWILIETKKERHRLDDPEYYERSFFLLRFAH